MDYARWLRKALTGVLRRAMQATIFISYRRNQRDHVEPAVAALRRANVDVFLDMDDIDPLANFPLRIRQRLSESHALLVWWSLDFSESEHCMQELRLAWQHARQKSSDVAKRIWVVNPEQSAQHIFAGELDSHNFLLPPAVGQEKQWAQSLSIRARGLLSEGPFIGEAPRPYLVEALYALVSKLAGRAAKPPSQDPDVRLSGVPQASAQFTGREQELWKIHSLLHPAQISPGISEPTVLINGASGFGKSELATKYATAFALSYPAGVFRLNFSGHEFAEYSENDMCSVWISTLKLSLSSHPWITSGRLKFDEKLPVDERAAKVRNELAFLLADQPSLWILDNFPIIRREDVRDRILASWAAPSPNGRTLVTTRDTRPFATNATVSLDVLREPEALKLLTRFRHPGTELSLARELIKEVGAHTLALTVLGHRLKHASGGYAFVLRTIRERGVLQRVEELASWERNELQLGERAKGVLATLASSLDALSTSATTLLAIASACAPSEPIPVWMIRDCYISWKGSADKTSGIDEVDAALAELVDSSLLRQRDHGAATGLEIHLLTAAAFWTHTHMPTDLIQSRLTYLLLSRSTLPNDKELANTPSTTPHIAQLVQNSPPVLATRLALKFAGQGDNDWMLNRALEIARNFFGEDHPYTLVALNNSASNSGFSNPDLAREYYEKVLAVIRPALGENHPLTLEVMLAQASLLKVDWARNDRPDFLMKVRRIEEKLVAVTKQQLGDKNPLTISTMKALASSCWCLGELKAAQQLDEQILAIYRRLLHDEDPRTNSAKANLHLSMASQDLEAPDLGRRGFRTYKRTWDAEHPRTLYEMSNVALHSGAVATARDLLAIAVKGLSEITVEEISQNQFRLELTGNFIADRINETEYIIREIEGSTYMVTLTQEYPNDKIMMFAKVSDDRRSIEMVRAPNILAADFDVIELMQSVGRNLLKINEVEDAFFLVNGAVDTQRRFFGGPRSDTLALLDSIASLRPQRAGQLHAAHPISNIGLLDDDAKATLRRNSNCPCGSGKKFKHCHGKFS
jgi:TIR domain-containing protein/SEC-C motif-containing protein/tetratricopeptide repeat protein